jgi:hypothetical protein
MKSITSWAMAVVIALFASAGVGRAQDAPTIPLFSIKSGETLLLRTVTSITANCEPLFVSFDSIDVIEGPPELSFKFEPGNVKTYTTSHVCPDAVPGGKVMVTANGVDERKEAMLVFRVRYQTKNGPWQQTGRYRIFMFPASQEPRSNTASLEKYGVSQSGDTVSRAPTPAPTTSVMLKAAESQIGRGEYDLAITELDKVLVIAPGSWAPYALRGLAYSGKKDYVRALADASKAIELDGSAALGFTIRCTIQLQTKAYDRALADCNKAIEIGPPNATSYAARGNVQLLLKSFDRAIADLDKAIAMGAKGSQATFTRGLAYLYSKEFSKATDDFRKVLEAEPDHRGAILGLRLLTQPLRNNASMQVNVVRNADPKCGDQCAEWIAAEGRIDGSTPERFRAVLKSTGNRKLPVFIDSMGGSLAASYEVGRIIRARNLDVYVTRTEPAQCASAAEVCRKALAAHIKFGLPRGKLASCASACTNILASGAVRSVGPTAIVGVHQAAYYAVQKDAVGMASDRRIPESVYVGMKDFFVEMGVDANLMLRLLATPHKDMYWLTYDELQSSRLANQARSGEELITGAESDEWLIVSPRAAQSLAKVTRETQKPK